MLIAIFVGFIFIIAILAINHQASAGHMNKIVKLKGRKQKLISEIKDIKRAMADYKELEMALNRQVEGISGEEGLNLGADLITGVEAPKRAAKAPANSLIDVLLAEKLLTTDDLAKAEAYKEQSKSPYSVDEILAMLGYVKPEVIERVKRRYPNLS